MSGDQESGWDSPCLPRDVIAGDGQDPEVVSAESVFESIGSPIGARGKIAEPVSPMGSPGRRHSAAKTSQDDSALLLQTKSEGDAMSPTSKTVRRKFRRSQTISGLPGTVLEDKDFGQDEVAVISPATQAVIWVKKASQGSDQWVEKCTEEQFYYWKLTKQLKPLWLTAKYCLLLLAILETPAPCAGTPWQCAHMSKTDYTMPFAVLPLRISAILSIVCYLILACRLRLRKWALGSAYVFHSWHVFNTVVLVLGVLSCLAGFVSPGIYEVSFFCRALIFIGGTKKLRETATQIVRSVPAFVDAILSLFVTIFVFTCIGMILFVKTPEGLADFKGWGDAIAQMWNLFCTTNDPNAWVPAINQNVFNFVFFFFYIVITLYLLQSLILAKCYDAYKRFSGKDVEHSHKKEQACILNAFCLLSDTGDISGHIDAQSWRAFFAEYCNPTFGGIQGLDPEDMQYNIWRGDLILSVFHGIDLEQGAGIGLVQFKTIIKVFLDRETYIPRRRPPTVSRADEIWLTDQIWSTLLDSYMKGVRIGGFTFKWDRMMDVMILICFFVTAREVLYFASGIRLQSIREFWVFMPISAFYALEVTIKISLLGFERFWNRKPTQHPFDFFNVYGLLIVQIVYMSHHGFQTMAMERAIILLSAARVFRLGVYVEPFEHVFSMVTRLIPYYWKMGMMLFMVYFLFATMGRCLFGGLIYSTNPALQATWGGSGLYAADHFFSLNFNDLVSGFVTLFALMIVNNWYITTSGFILATGSVCASIFFVAFFVVCNLIVLNILLALIIEVTCILSEEEAEKHTQEEALTHKIGRGVSGIGDAKPEYMLKKVLAKEDELYAEHKITKRKFPTRGRTSSAENIRDLNSSASSDENSSCSATDSELASPTHGSRKSSERRSPKGRSLASRFGSDFQVSYGTMGSL